MTSRGLIWALLLLTVGALALRLPYLERRPLHTDESVHTIKFQGLWDRGTYRYDPDEYHGPSLYYLTAPVVWASGAKTFADTTIGAYRLVPVLFGVALVPLVWWLRDGLGRTATMWAALLVAVSPAMVFYSRYYIHEMPLVAFTGLTLAAGWRYLRRPGCGWAIAFGVGVGLMYATKETFVIALAAMAAAAVATVVWGKLLGEPLPDWRPYLKPLPLGLSAFTAVVLGCLFFTSFLTHARGPLDSLRTYLPWFNRAKGSSTFTVNDFRNLPRFAAALQGGTNVVATWLQSRLSEPTRAALAQPPGASSNTPALAERLATDLNELISGPSIYQPALFDGLAKRIETRKLLARRLSVTDRTRLNRLLLEDAFPRDLARSVRSPHIHPWFYYFDLTFGTSYFTQATESLDPKRWVSLLPWWRRRLVWTEGLILVLAVVGIVASLRRATPRHAVLGVVGEAAEPPLDRPHAGWSRFLAFYTLILAFAYAVIPYKTPWCMLGYHHGLILLAGLGFAALWRGCGRTVWRWGLAAVTLLGVGQLGAQTCRANFSYPADPRNPYVYAHTVPDIERLTHRVNRLAGLHPDGAKMLVQVVADGGDYWPLPWYLRGLTRVGWYPQVPADPQAPVWVVSPSQATALEAAVGTDYQNAGFFGHRPAVFLVLYVRKELWARYLAAPKTDEDD